MKPTKGIALEQLDALLAGRRQYAEGHYETLAELGVQLLAAVDRFAPPGTAYRSQAHAIVNDYGGVISPTVVDMLYGTLSALREDINQGHLESIHELIHAEMFADFLEMAHYFLEEGYKEPAAVLTGGALEEHSRQLCAKNGIAVDEAGKPRKASSLNADLAKAEVYEKLDQKNVTAWLDLRNKAAHGKHKLYEAEQVRIMLSGVRDFITRHPA